MAGKKNSECGSVFGELALVAPLLVVLTICVTDFGLFLQSYFRAMHIAREGMRAAVSVPNLEANFGSSASAYSGVYSVRPATVPVVSYNPSTITDNHYEIHERIRRLLMVENGVKKSLQLRSDQVEITTQCINNGNGGLVQVAITGRYEPLLPIDMIFGPGAGLRFRARAEGNYLFANCA